MIEKQQQKKKNQVVKTIKDDKQYEIEVTVSHGLGSRSKQVIRLRIKWVGYDQTTLERVKATKKRAWVMVEEYGKK